VSRSSVAALIVATGLLAGCQGGATATPGPGANGSGGASQSADAPPTLGPPPSPTQPDDTSPVELDRTVLAFLPETVAGVTVSESVNEATQALADPALQTMASALDAGVAADAGSGNLVYAWVVRLRQGKFGDEVYRQWRDSYDQGACGGNASIVGRAQATIDARTVYITSCTQGLRTYHVWLQNQGILISASAIGDGKFGEQLMDNLRVPA
jgi:hypothetical protein